MKSAVIERACLWAEVEVDELGTKIKSLRQEKKEEIYADERMYLAQDIKIHVKYKKNAVAILKGLRQQKKTGVRYEEGMKWYNNQVDQCTSYIHEDHVC